MNSKVTYRQQFSHCGKANCRKCRDGQGHGPYWYAYRTEHGQTTRTYIGKQLPAGVQLEDTQAVVTSTTSPPPTPVYIGRTHLTPLIGRDNELASLHQLLQVSSSASMTKASRQASAIPLDTLRRPQCMVLLGEAGMGKTRLAEELSREAQERDWAVAWSRSYAQESSIPYRLWIEILRNLINGGLWQKQDLQEHPQDYARLAALLPELYDQLPRQLAAPFTQSAGQEQQSLWEAIQVFFTTVLARTPLLIVLDDLQWADTSSGELLGYLARRLSHAPIVLLATCRDIELPPKHPLRSLLAHMQREHTVATMTVAPLNDEQISTLVAHTQLPEAALHYIQKQAGGNPFFAEELAYAYNIEPPGSKGRTPRASPVNLSSLPRSIAAALDQRLSKLSSQCQQLLADAAVLGGSFEFSLICSMKAGSAASMDEDGVLDLLDEALQAGVLVEEGRGARINYSFWQPLLVGHLYNGLSATKRALLHRRAADILRKLYAKREADGAATITHHLVEGGAETAQIAYYARLAGDAAYVLSAYPEAQRYYRLAVEHISAQTSEERLSLVYLLEQFAECTRILGDFTEARRCYERALAERHALHNDALSQSETQRETQFDALLLSEIGWTWYYSGDHAKTQQYCDEGKQVLREAGVAVGTAWARLHFQQSYIYWQAGNYDAALSAAYEALRLFEEALQHSPKTPSTPLTRLRRTLAGDPVDLARTHRLLSNLANSVGQTTEAIKHLHTALTILEQHDHQREVAHVCCNLGHLHLRKAEYQQAQVYLRRSLTLAERLGDTPLMAVIFSNLGELAVHSGNLAEAENWLHRSLMLAEQINDQVYVSTWNALLATVLQAQGKLAEAGICVRSALSIARAIHNTPCLGFALVALGNLRIAQALEVRKTQPGEHHEQFTHYLMRARGTLGHALTFERLEAEARNRGELASAQVSLLLGDTATARIQASHALRKAQQYEMVWLVGQAERLLESM